MITHSATPPSPLTYRQVLVTGAAGWVGSRLVEALAGKLPGLDLLGNNLRLKCLVMPGQDPAPLSSLSPSVEVIHGDIRNPSDCTRLCSDAEGAVLFHTAGMIHPQRVRDFYDINVTGTSNLVAAATTARVRRAVVLSSNSPCGCNPHPDHLFDEHSPYRPYMNYGRSKMQMEAVVQQCQREGRLQTVLLRPPWFYGPNQPPRQTTFFRMIRDGKAPIVGSGENLRSMCYVDNLCQAMLRAAFTDGANGKTYWIADRRPYSMNEIISTVERLLSQEFGQKCVFKRMRLPGMASDLAQLADATLQSLGIYHQKIHVLSEMNKTIACCVGLAERELGYKPEIELEEGMRRSLAWCQSRGMLA